MTVAEVAFGLPPKDGGLVARGAGVIRRLELSAPPSRSGEGRGLETEFNRPWPVSQSVVSTA